jgi:copper(I)-binding protein
MGDAVEWMAVSPRSPTVSKSIVPDRAAAIALTASAIALALGQAQPAWGATPSGAAQPAAPPAALAHAASAIATRTAPATAAAPPADHVAPAQGAAVLALVDAYARATPPGARTAAVYLTVRNRGVADAIVAARTPVAGDVEIHDMRMEGGVMRMRPAGNVAVPAGGEVAFKPGGLHLMLMDPKPLRAGDRFPITVTFAHGGAVTAEVRVEGLAAGAHSH